MLHFSSPRWGKWQVFCLPHKGAMGLREGADCKTNFLLSVKHKVLFRLTCPRSAKIPASLHGDLKKTNSWSLVTNFWKWCYMFWKKRMAAVLRIWRGRGSTDQSADVQIRSQRPGRDLRICVSNKVPGDSLSIKILENTVFACFRSFTDDWTKAQALWQGTRAGPNAR